MIDPAADAARPLRILTYNVHRCLGVDGVYAPARIAAVLEECEADIIALQELDVGRLRSGGVDQADFIARELGIGHVHFQPALRCGEELYGDAILTRAPSRIVRAAALPGIGGWRPREPRGAIWVQVGCRRHNLQVITAHLGLGRRERWRQAGALLGPDWLGHSECIAPLVLLGDLNSLPGGRVHRAFSARLREILPTGGATFPTFRPLFRIDHIFASAGLLAREARVHRSALARIASDHFPVVADLAPVEAAT